MFDRFTSWAGGALESIVSAGKKVIVPVLSAGFVGLAVLGGGVNEAQAVPAVAPTPATFSEIYGVIDPITMSYAIATLGGVALVAAFSVGGGFKIGKKAYSWIMGKL